LVAKAGLLKEYKMAGIVLYKIKVRCRANANMSCGRPPSYAAFARTAFA